jgi:hypothetical protein
MLDKGVYTSTSDIGDAENISKSYVNRILRRALLARDIVEGILEGRAADAREARATAADGLGRLAQPLVSGQHPAYWHCVAYRRG